MGIFGGVWKGYQDKIFYNWNKIVGRDDLVLIPGDISWAMKVQDAEIDLRKIDELNGKKILLKGNHDYWWESLNKLNKLGLNSIRFLQNNSFQVKDVNICGTRGWKSKDSKDYNPSKDESVFKRELLRLEMSLDNRDKLLETLAMLHYPPFNSDGIPNEFANILSSNGVKKCIYGHLHGEGLKDRVEGVFDGVEYICVSADKLDFKPLSIY